MRNSHRWRPTKAALHARGVVRVPACAGGVASGSVLAASLIARWYAMVLPQHAIGRVLDVGCGRLPWYGIYRGLAAEVLATDWPGSLHGNEFIDFACNLEFGLPVRTSCIDTVIASDVLEHLFHPCLALAEIQRVLRPGGKALINVPFLYWVHEAPHDYFRYSPHAIRRMAEEAGFEVLHIDALGGAACVIVDNAAKVLQRVPLLGRPLARGMQRLLLAMLPLLPNSQIFPLHVAAVIRKPLLQDG